MNRWTVIPTIGKIVAFAGAFALLFLLLGWVNLPADLNLGGFTSREVVAGLLAFPTASAVGRILAAEQPLRDPEYREPEA